MSSASRKSSVGSNISRRSGTSRRSRTANPNPLLMASAQSLNDHLSRSLLPYASLSLVVALVLVYSELLDLPLFYVKNACLGLYQVFYLEEYLRVFTCHLVHAGRWELATNLLSFLWKGNGIESKCGPIYFLLMLALFAPCCSLVLVVFNKALADMADPLYVTQCYYGLSSINFALKVVLARLQSDSNRSEQRCLIGGRICIPTKHFIWLEFLLSHSLATTPTIVANLAGVVVGLMFTYGPLQKLLDFIMGLSTGTLDWSSLPFRIGNIAGAGGSLSSGFGSPLAAGREREDSAESNDDSRPDPAEKEE